MMASVATSDKANATTSLVARRVAGIGATQASQDENALADLARHPPSAAMKTTTGVAAGGSRLLCAMRSDDVRIHASSSRGIHL